MKKALFILDHFPPSFAPRMGYLVKYLKPLGWEAKVFSSPHPSKINKFDGLVGYAYSEEVTMPEYCKVHSLNRLLVEALGFFSGGFCTALIVRREPCADGLVFVGHDDAARFIDSFRCLLCHLFRMV
ncbi:MAG: hypothetical protein J6Q47_00300, partial [Paludibacteraceae bacterium]|nr:hypothetical protein [Paludibacteraceae bacterium]